MTVPAAPEHVETPGAIAAVVVAESAERLEACLSAVGRQVYGPAQVWVVGGDARVRAVAAAHEVPWRPRLGAALAAVGAHTEYVWLLRDGARPRPDALAALVRDGARAEASVAGSKVLDAADPAVLLSVGYATDVFDAPYSGLQEGELDQQQYDVIRDVAAVSAVSMLVRLDLFRGLGGFDSTMGPMSAAVDFCQRARLRGARVVVVPSSEVLLDGEEAADGWRERAGELRAMQKVYSPITLAWAMPLAFLSGLAESLAGPFLGRFPLLGFLGGWLWNLLYLPATVAQRWSARRGRVVGDEELFRYQTGGSARLRALFDRGLERLRARFPEGVLSGFSDVLEAGQERLRRPAVAVVLAVIAFAFVATRILWTGDFPVDGFALPPPESATAALGSYAGGWNPAGLGSPEVLRPEVAATALVQLVLFGNGALAVGLLTLAAFLCGVIGAGRLLRVWGIGPVPGYLAGTVLMAGPATVALAGKAVWGPLIALGAVPWVVTLAVGPWPDGWRRRVGRASGVVLTTGVVGAFAPAALPMPAVAVLLWALVGRGRRWSAVALAWGAALLALPLLMPWVLYSDLPGLYTDGAAAFWEPGWLLAVAAAALVLTVAAGDPAVSAVAGWGGFVAVLGGVLARAGDLGLGREAEQTGLIAAALGVAVVVGAALEAGARRRRVGGPRGAAGALAALAAVILVGSTVGVALPGRGGLPEDRYSDLLAFATAGGDTGSRVLLFGPAEDLPGTSRDFEGLGYRLLDPPYPESWDAYLPEARLGDEALRHLLDELLGGDVRRAGERLAVFGVGWVAFTESSPLEAVFEAQLDMVPLRGLALPVFRNEVAATEAYGPGGTPWPGDGTVYRKPEGTPSGLVYVASNADYRWGPGSWSQADWANQIDTAGTEVRFSGHAGRRNLALGSAAWLAVLGGLLAVGWWGRRGER